MALNGCSLGAFLSNIGYWHTCDHVHCIFVPSILLYCKAISMEWMNANVEFVLTPVTGYTVCERVCVGTTRGARLQQAYIPTIMPRQKPHPDQNAGRLLHKLFNIKLLHATGRIVSRQMKSNSLKSGESQLSCSELTLHSFQSVNSWLRFDGQTVNCLNA